MSEKRLPRADHHEAMKQSGFLALLENPREMRISQRFSTKEEPVLLHGFMVIYF
jgi:hypothetical protein